ncbi:hypothetical protein R1sor_013060 [Riccia sorocarpa]|uniref:RING-type domain-containing protein n=1 Tax=Riccia sorocarpa TaxID=122646 RepID=A0ABD3H7B0_9MARC
MKKKLEPELESVKKKLEPETGDAEWTEDEFVLSVEYFTTECRLPNDGLMPGEVLKTLVSDELLEKCFGPRFGKNGRNGPKLKACTGLPQSEVLHLFQVIDGHEKPVNGTLGATFPRALYVERFLKKRINWAAYAHERHRNQIRTAKTRGDSRPTGPPVIRPKRVYTPPATLVLEPLQPTSDSEQKGSPSEHKSQCGAEVLPEEQLVGEGDIDVIDCKENAGFTDGGITKFKKNSAPEGSTSPVVIVRSKMPGVEELRGDILVRKRRVETLRNEVKAVTNAIENNRKKLEETEETITRAEESLKKEKLLSNQLWIDRMNAEKKKQELEIRLDDVEESAQKLVRLEEELESTRANAKKLEDVITDAEAEIEKKGLVLESEESMLESQEAEMNILRPLAEVSTSVLTPRFVPIASEVTKSVFRVTSCPVCALGFHCVNFMPTSCGHAYHPACLMALIARSAEPKCLE